MTQTGPVLFTHWGLSGPAVIKLSAFGALVLHAMEYKSLVHLNFLPEKTADDVFNELIKFKEKNLRKLVITDCPFNLPKNLWRKQVEIMGIEIDKTWQSLPNKTLLSLGQLFQKTTLKIEGKTTYKEEFVTAGGVCLNEINFKNFQSKVNPSLYFAGEILDIDGVTGGFNFQNAWTSGYLAGSALANNDDPL